MVFLSTMGCDDTEDFFLKENDKPTATFTFLKNAITHVYDSVKLTASGTGRRYQQAITVQDDNNNLKGVFFSIESGKGYVFSNGFQRSQLQVTTSGAVNGIYEFIYQPQELGYHEIRILAVDDFFEADTLTISLNVFNNMKPVAKFNVKPSRVVSRYEYTIDGSESFDRDARFGGEIKQYQYQINSTIIELEKPKFSYVFGSEQIVSISLRVKDSDDEWSEVAANIFSID